MIPTWLQRHLEATGRWNADGVRRAARNGRCPQCAAPTLTGLDAEPLGLVATADPTPLSPIGEVLAIATSRRTYNLVIRPQRLELDHRDRWRISNPHRGTVLPEHRCHSPLPTDTDHAARIPTPTPGRWADTPEF